MTDPTIPAWSRESDLLFQLRRLREENERLREALAEQATQQCWKCGDMDAAFHAKCDVPACGIKEKP